MDALKMFQVEVTIENEIQSYRVVARDKVHARDVLLRHLQFPETAKHFNVEDLKQPDDGEPRVL